MRKEITVIAEPRQGRGKNEARRLRVRGLTPAVVYGAQKEPIAIAVNPKHITRILHSASGHNTVFNLDIQGVETTPAMIVDTQQDPVTDRLLHADLLRIDPNKRIKVKVAVHLEGEARGVKAQSGTLEVVSREIEIECLPEEIPDSFTVNITNLMVGQHLRAADIPLSGSMKLVSNPNLVLAHVVGSRSQATATPAEGAGPAEPEVIKKGKKEEAGAEAKTEAKGGAKKK
ncbi:MAG: 50S ribosomal protein L25 [Bryobacteraceae bacterium]|nr:50S ribosomal protein L25 [Bryobacteraceae bacterium]MDW8376873.1 50S ribosomal protein L25 [Bryobacterales bacterium]